MAPFFMQIENKKNKDLTSAVNYKFYFRPTAKIKLGVS